MANIVPQRDVFETPFTPFFLKKGGGINYYIKKCSSGQKSWKKMNIHDVHHNIILSMATVYTIIELCVLLT